MARAVHCRETSQCRHAAELRDCSRGLCGARACVAGHLDSHRGANRGPASAAAGLPRMFDGEAGTTLASYRWKRRRLGAHDRAGRGSPAGVSPRRWAVRSTYGRVSKVRYAPGRPTWIDKVPDRHSGMGAVRLDGARQGWRKCLSQIENARFARVNVGSIERPFQSSAHGSHDKAVMAPYAWLAANRAGELGLPVRRVSLEGAGCRRFGSDASGCSCSAPESRSDLLRWRAGCVPGGRGRTSMFG
jgi:hypothetical protein